MASRSSGSKGCQSCRTRRVRCDGLRPICSRCQADGVECGGYATPVKFVFHDVSKQRRKQPASGPKNDTSLRKLDDTVLISHLHRILYNIPPGEDGGVGEWVGFAAHDRPGDLAHSCLLSMSQSFYGLFRKATPLAMRGRQLYGECLALVNDNLRDAKKQKTNDTLRSVVILGAYELMSETDPMGWIRHAQGVAMLLQLRGSSACRNREFFDMFRGNRYYITLASLATSTPTYLAHDEWKYKPWKLASVGKNTGDKLLDLLVDLPALIARRLNDTDVATITSEALEVLDKLEQWWQDWKSLPSSRMFEVPTSDNPDGLKTWETEISCISLYAANSYALYNAIVILAIDIAVTSAGPEDFKLGSGEASQLLIRSRSAAMEICRIIDFHLKHPCGRMSELILIWPIRMAWTALGKDSTPEGRWLELCNEEITTKRGYWEVAGQTFSMFEG